MAEGGNGGFGNLHFKSSTNQAPRKANPGQEGVERTIWLRLKLIADVGLLGMPNAGKSTFLSATSNARPKIADYPFTTLYPNLGVVGIDSSEFVVADIPGLIEGAHLGHGLGDLFLGHVERCSVLVHIIDITNDDFINNFSIIMEEVNQLTKFLDLHLEFLFRLAPSKLYHFHGVQNVAFPYRSFHCQQRSVVYSGSQ